MKIVFMGTPEFAVPSLDILVQAGYDIVGVITATDKYGGRGNKTLIESAVKKYAIDKDLKVLQPTNLKSTSFNEELASLQADLQIVVAFRMLPKIVWDAPRYGTYNLHGSLLPKYRGAAPINWAIINGESETGVTSFKLKHEIDTGNILHQKKIPIYPSDNASTLHDRMKWIAADTVLETVKSIEKNDLNLLAQDNTEVTHAPKLNKDNTTIDWEQSAETVQNQIRGLSPYPAAWTLLDGKKLKIYQSHYELENHNKEPGRYYRPSRFELKVTTSDGCIHLKEVQLSGKKRMNIKEFLNGYNFNTETEIIEN